MNDLVVHQQPSLLTLPPREMIARATEYAEVLSDVIEKQKLFTIIQGKKYVRVEGWLTLGTMLGFTAKEREVYRLSDGSYEASVDIIRYSDGVTLGGASALCSVTEKRWATADEYARRSMAITRAVGKAYRINFSWIVALSGYETTPEEEMPREEKQPEIYQGAKDQLERINKTLSAMPLSEEQRELVRAKMIDQPVHRFTSIVREVTAQ